MERPATDVAVGPLERRAPVERRSAGHLQRQVGHRDGLQDGVPLGRQHGPQRRHVRLRVLADPLQRPEDAPPRHPQRVNEISRRLPGLSRGLLSKRLDRLVRAGLVERSDGRCIEYGAAVRDGLLTVTGDTALVRALPRALRFSPIAGYVRAAAAAR